MEQKDESLFGLEFDHQASAYLTQSAKWSKFQSIVWFVLCGIFIVIGIFAGSLIASSGVMGFGSGSSMSAGIVTAAYLVIAAIQLVPNVFRYQFAVKALKAVRNNDQQALNESLQKLGSYNKYWGILTIIIIAFYAIIFIFGMFAALMR